MVEVADLENEYDYTVEFDDGTEYAHLYFANIVDMDNPSYVRFDPLYELGKDVERQVVGETVMIPYSKVLKITKRKPD